MPTLTRPTLTASAASVPLARCTGAALTSAPSAFARFVICPLESWYLIARIPTEHTRSFGTAPPRSPLPSRFRPACAAAKACLSVGGLPRTKTAIFPAISSNGRSTAAHGRRYTRASTAVRAGRLGLQQSAGKRAGPNLPGVRPAVVLHYAACYLGGGHNALFDLGV